MFGSLNRKLNVLLPFLGIVIISAVLHTYVIFDLMARVEVLEKYEKTYTKYSELHDMISNCEKMKSKRVKNNCQIVFHIK